MGCPEGSDSVASLGAHPAKCQKPALEVADLFDPELIWLQPAQQLVELIEHDVVRRVVHVSARPRGGPRGLSLPCVRLTR